MLDNMVWKKKSVKKKKTGYFEAAAGDIWIWKEREKKALKTFRCQNSN